MNRSLRSFSKLYGQNQKLFNPSLTSPAYNKIFKLSQSTSVASSNGVYELRTYSVHPHRMAEQLNFVKETFHLRTKHSPLCAYWVTELGGVNQVVHLWFYDDLNHRASVRSKMSQNDEWKSQFLSKVTPMLQKMDNQLFTLHENSPQPKFSQSSSVFDLHYFVMDGSTDQWDKETKEVLEVLVDMSSKDNSSSLVGLWKSEIGEGNVVLMIWSHNSPNDVGILRSKLNQCPAYKTFANKTSSSYTKMLNPTLTNLWS